MTEYEIKVYKIWFADAPDAIYIGSTKRTLAQRMGGHRRDASKGVKTSLICRTMREKGVNNFEYCMLGSCIVSDKDQQRMFEQTYIERLKPTLNTNRAYSTEDDYKQKQREYQRTPEYRQREKERKQTPDQKQKKQERDRIRRARTTPV